MPAYVAELRDGRYVLDVFDGDDFDDWSWRVAVDAENVASRFGVGDVVSLPTSVTRDPIEVRADEVTARRIRAAHRQFEDRVESHARDHGVDLDRPRDGFSDGDLLFLASPPADEEVPPFPDGETLYTTPEGFLTDGLWTPVDFAYLVGRPRSTIDAGLFFEVVELDDVVLGLHYDRDATESARSRPLKTYFHHASAVSDLENVEAESDLEPPLYVMIDGYDDGAYDAHLFDSATPPADGRYRNYRRVDSYGTTTPPYLVEKQWPYSSTAEDRLIPVERVTLDESKDPPRLVAIASRNDRPVVPE